MSIFKRRVEAAEAATAAGMPFEPFTRPRGTSKAKWHAMIDVEFHRVARDWRHPYAAHVTELYFDSMIPGLLAAMRG